MTQSSLARRSRAYGSRLLRLSQRVPLGLILLVVFNLAPRPVTAQGFLGPITKSCTFQKASSVTTKILAVYISHVITIKLQPGIGIWKTLEAYILAALLPSSSSAISLLDLMYRTAKFDELNRDDDQLEIYKDMQRAINCGAGCFRIETSRRVHGRIVWSSIPVRAKPLRAGEVFVAIPRGTSARRFAPMLVQGSSQLIKALVGAVQVGLATLQLVSANNPRVSAYGYGAFIYTIIPYAFSSIINLIGAIFTDSYSDLAEFELLDEPQDDRPDAPPGFVHMESARDEDPMYFLGILQYCIYLAIVGGITRFRNGISTKAQRGWFMSWALLGTIYGAFLYQAGNDSDINSVKVKYESVQGQGGSETPGSPTTDNVSGAIAEEMQKKRRPDEQWIILICAPFYIATIGGFVAMIQQYIHLFECQQSQ